MPSRSIPPRPSLEFDRKQARALLEAVRRGDADAVERFRAHHPRFRDGAVAHVALHDAQLVIAREYGVASWPRWKQLVEMRQLEARERAGLLVRAACEGDMRQASTLLAADPALQRFDLYTACVAGADDEMARRLNRDPALARGRGGLRWRRARHGDPRLAELSRRFRRHRHEAARGDRSRRLSRHRGAAHRGGVAAPPSGGGGARRCRTCCDGPACLTGSEAMSKTRLFNAVKTLDVEAVSALLDAHPELVRVKDERRRNALHFLCGRPASDKTEARSLALARLLLDGGFDVNEPAFVEGDGAFKATPLWYTLSRGRNLPLAKLLLKRGSTPEYCLWTAGFTTTWRPSISS